MRTGGALQRHAENDRVTSVSVLPEGNLQRGSRRKARNELREVGRNFFEPYKEVWILSGRSCEPLKTFE